MKIVTPFLFTVYISVYIIHCVAPVKEGTCNFAFQLWKYLRMRIKEF